MRLGDQAYKDTEGFNKEVPNFTPRQGIHYTLYFNFFKIFTFKFICTCVLSGTGLTVVNLKAFFSTIRNDLEYVTSY